MSQDPLSTKIASPAFHFSTLRRRCLHLAAVGLLGAGFGCRPAAPPRPEAAPVAVTVEEVQAAPFQAALDLLATVEPAATVELRAPAAGRLLFPGTRGLRGLVAGRRVDRGETLFEVESPDLALAVREAELSQRAAKSELDRTRLGVEGGFMPQADLARREIDHELATERLAAARAEIDRLRVSAPLAGVLRVETPRSPGSEVTAGDLVVELAAEGAPRLVAWATASDLARLEVGVEVEGWDAAGGRRLGLGRLVEIGSHLDEGGVAQVAAVIEQDVAMPPPGSGAVARVLLEAREAALTVPTRSLVIDGSLSSVFVLEGSGAGLIARARLVQVGGRRDDRVEILDGLEEGEKVAVEGAELLSDGLAAKDVNAKKRPGVVG